MEWEPNRAQNCTNCSELSATEAQALHGVGVDGCWNPKVCHSRRTYYRYWQRYIAALWHRRHPDAARQQVLST